MFSEPFYRNGTESSANCTAEGYPPPNFLWYKVNNQVASGSTLYFNKILVSDAGDYRCQVNNAIGAKSDSVYVNVTCKSFLSWHLLLSEILKLSMALTCVHLRSSLTELCELNAFTFLSYAGSTERHYGCCCTHIHNKF